MVDVRYMIRNSTDIDTHLYGSSTNLFIQTVFCRDMDFFYMDFTFGIRRDGRGSQLWVLDEEI